MRRSTDGHRHSIRRARPEDAGTLAAAEREIAWAPGRLASRPDELKDEAFRQKIEALSGGGAGIDVLLEEDGAIVGHAVREPHRLAATSHVVFLTTAIHKGHRGPELGRRLMNHLVPWAKAHPRIEKIELQVRSLDARAPRPYQCPGFVEEGRKTRRLRDGPGDSQHGPLGRPGGVPGRWDHDGSPYRYDRS